METSVYFCMPSVHSVNLFSAQPAVILIFPIVSQPEHLSMMLPTFAAERSRYQSPLVLSLDRTDGRTLDRYTDPAAHTRLAASVSQLHFDSTISLIYFFVYLL